MATSPSSSSSSYSFSLSTLSLSRPTEPLFTVHSAESVDAYPSGGYHPACIGEWLHQRQYQIIHKLGSGASSTFWLARDSCYVQDFLPLFHYPELCLDFWSQVAWITFFPLSAFYNRNSRNVALKIKKALTSSDDSELSILNSLCQKTEFHDGAAHVISMLK